jgi:hypothetical protein
VFAAAHSLDFARRHAPRNVKSVGTPHHPSLVLVLRIGEQRCSAEQRDPTHKHAHARVEHQAATQQPDERGACAAAVSFLDSITHPRLSFCLRSLCGVVVDSPVTTTSGIFCSAQPPHVAFPYVFFDFFAPIALYLAVALRCALLRVFVSYIPR